MTVSTLEGKVAQILNGDQLAINIGWDDGVRPGMVFAILSSVEFLEIRDPDTKQVLGTVAQEKARLVARQVLPRFTICTSVAGRIEERPPPTIEALFASARPLDPLVGADGPKDRYIDIGDRVRQVE